MNQIKGAPKGGAAARQSPPPNHKSHDYRQGDGQPLTRMEVSEMFRNRHVKGHGSKPWVSSPQLRLCIMYTVCRRSDIALSFLHVRPANQPTTTVVVICQKRLDAPGLKFGGRGMMTFVAILMV